METLGKIEQILSDIARDKLTERPKPYGEFDFDSCIGRFITPYDELAKLEIIYELRSDACSAQRSLFESDPESLQDTTDYSALLIESIKRSEYTEKIEIRDPNLRSSLQYDPNFMPEAIDSPVKEERWERTLKASVFGEPNQNIVTLQFTHTPDSRTLVVEDRLDKFDYLASESKSDLVCFAEEGKKLAAKGSLNMSEVREYLTGFLAKYVQ